MTHLERHKAGWTSQETCAHFIKTYNKFGQRNQESHHFRQNLIHTIVLCCAEPNIEANEAGASTQAIICLNTKLALSLAFPTQPNIALDHPCASRASADRQRSIALRQLLSRMVSGQDTRHVALQLGYEARCHFQLLLGLLPDCSAATVHGCLKLAIELRCLSAGIHGA